MTWQNCSSLMTALRLRLGPLCVSGVKYFRTSVSPAFLEFSTEGGYIASSSSESGEHTLVCKEHVLKFADIPRT